ncbi:helix-turn-helix domain-containing protein [Cetobacterium somerae]
MENLNILIGQRLNRLRKEKNLSLEELSLQTGVSKAMLSQIENGKSNPTVSTLWKISTALKVSFSFFIDGEEEELNVVDEKNIVPILENNNLMKLYPIFPFDSNRNFEILTIELKKGCNHVSQPHNSGVEEYIIVSEGTLELHVENKIFALSKGQSIKFLANKEHTYRNTQNEVVRFHNLIFY